MASNAVMTIDAALIRQYPALTQPVAMLAQRRAETEAGREAVELAEAEHRVSASRQADLANAAGAVEQDLIAARDAALEGLMAGREVDSKIMDSLARLEARHKLILEATDRMAERVRNAQRRILVRQIEALELEAAAVGAEIDVRRELIRVYGASLAALEGGQLEFESPAVKALHGQAAALMERAAHIRARLNERN